MTTFLLRATDDVSFFFSVFANFLDAKQLVRFSLYTFFMLVGSAGIFHVLLDWLSSSQSGWDFIMVSCLFLVDSASVPSNYWTRPRSCATTAVADFRGVMIPSCCPYKCFYSCPLSMIYFCWVGLVMVDHPLWDIREPRLYLEATGETNKLSNFLFLFSWVLNFVIALVSTISSSLSYEDAVESMKLSFDAFLVIDLP